LLVAILKIITAMDDSPHHGSLVAVTKTMKEAYNAKVARSVPQGDSPSSHEAQTCSSEVPRNLRNLLQANQDAMASPHQQSQYPPPPNGGEDYHQHHHNQHQMAPAEERLLSPKDVIIKAGTRKRQEALYTAFTAKDEEHHQQQANPKGQLYDVNFIGNPPPPQRTNVPVHQVYLGGREQATSPSAYIHQQTTISRGIASGEMKIDPVTNKYVPNDIFVQAMGPGGVLPDCPPLKKHSKYRGVTKHRRSGRWESHIWLKETGRQMYLGAYENEDHAAEAYDVAALKIKGDAAKINFDRSKYKQYMELLDTLTLAELVKTVKSQVPPPVRHTSSYRGVTYNTKRNMWEAKYQAGDKSQISLGLFKDDTKAAKEYDRAMVRHHGTGSSINFEHSEYEEELLAYHQDQIQKLDSASE
jgi:hypothetical protein